MVVVKMEEKDGRGRRKGVRGGVRGYERGEGGREGMKWYEVV